MTVRLELGDCLEVLPRLRREGVLVDAVVTDSPYHLASVTKRLGDASAKPIRHGTDGAFARASAGFMGQKWDGGDVAFRPETWRAVMDVMKPGAWLVAFGGTRTFHRLAKAVEDAGFEIRDRLWNAIAADTHVERFLDSLSAEQRDAFALAIEDSQFGGELAWVFGSGMPKGADVRGGDADYSGKGVLLKPAHEPRAHAEIWNDLDSHLVNLFRVLRDPAASAELIRRLELTPFARDEFNAAYEEIDEPVEAARRLLVRSFMGHGSDGATGHYRTGFRADSNKSGTTPAHDWVNYPAALKLAVERLRGVVIENRPAHQVMARHDNRGTLHFVDPPYPLDLRTRTHRRPSEAGGGVYRHELSRDEHVELLDFLKTLKGMVVLSGYPSPLYDEALAGWRRVERAAMADGALPRTEVLWINPAAATRAKGPLL